MKFKGAWASDTVYDVGDVVIYEGLVYHKQKPCAAGIKPIDTLYFGKLSQEASEIVIMLAGMFADLFDAVGALDTAVAGIPKNIDDESISLKAGDNEYLITVDDSGETPELAVELIEAEEEGD